MYLFPMRAFLFAFFLKVHTATNDYFCITYVYIHLCFVFGHFRTDNITIQIFPSVTLASCQ